MESSLPFLHSMWWAINFQNLVAKVRTEWQRVCIFFSFSFLNVICQLSRTLHFQINVSWKMTESRTYNPNFIPISRLHICWKTLNLSRSCPLSFIHQSFDTPATPEPGTVKILTFLSQISARHLLRKVSLLKALGNTCWKAEVAICNCIS